MFLIGDVAYRDGAAGAPGLVIRRRRVDRRLGYDSIAILAAYGLGLAGLYHLR